MAQMHRRAAEAWEERAAADFRQTDVGRAEAIDIRALYYGVVLCPSTYRVRGFYAGLEAASDVLGQAIRNALGQ